MATITTSTFLDTATGTRTAGEAWTMNGALLTIRTDTRWHAKSPAGMLGSIGATTISAALGGGVLIDSTRVRWMPYNGGSGNVPVIGATITQGGVTGILLGVWLDYASSPSAVGSAMPVTGYLKFREVDGGQFTIGALAGIGASAAAPDRQGWIEIVEDQGIQNTIPRLGFFRTRGGWFELDQVTDGTAGQLIQIPTNGGGVNTHVPAVWIETGVGTGEYELYNAIRDTWFIPANIATDIRGKFVQTIGNGQVRIGSDGTNDVGYVPPAGCRIRIPSNIGRQTTSANRALNLVPHATIASRPRFTVTSAGVVDLEFFMNDWYHLFASAYNIRIINSATFDIHSSSNEASPMELENYGNGAYLGNIICFVSTANSLGGTVKNCKFIVGAAGSNIHVMAITTSNDIILENCTLGVIQFARSSGRSISLSQCLNIHINDCKQFNSYIQIATSFGTRVKNIDHTDRLVGETNATTGIYAVSVLTSSDDTIVDGLTFGLGGLIPNVNCYLSPFYSINSSNTIFRNAGTIDAPLQCKAGFAPIYACHDAGVNTNLKFQRIYLQLTRTSAFLTVNTSKNVTFESVFGTVGALQTLALNALVKGVRATSASTTGGPSVYGTHVFDMFTSDTGGILWFAMNEPTLFSKDYVQLNLAGELGGFTSGGQVNMQTIGDELIIETPYYVLGHTGLANTAVSITGTNTGNFSYEYDIDRNDGNGFSGVYKICNAENFNTEVFNPSLGFKVRLKIVCTVAVATNVITYVRIITTTTKLAQGNLYPLDYAKVTLSGYVLGTRIQIYDMENHIELYNGVPSSAILNYLAPYVSAIPVRIRAMYTSGTTAKKFIEIYDTLTPSGISRSIPQSDENIYIVNGIDGSSVTNVTIVDNDLLVNVNTGIITWAEIYAYETYWLYSEEGIRDEGRFIDAVDTANYKLYYFKIKNVSNPSLPLVLTGGWAVDALTGKSIDIIDISGGTIFSAPEHVVPFEINSSGGGGATPAEIWNYGTRTLSNSGVTTIKNGLATQEEVLKIKNNTDLIPALL